MRRNTYISDLASLAFLICFRCGRFLRSRVRTHRRSHVPAFPRFGAGTDMFRAPTDGCDGVKDDALADGPASPRPVVTECFTPHGSLLCDAYGHALVRIGQ